MHPSDFTTQELFQAFAWGMDETTARKYAEVLSGDFSPSDSGYSNFNEEFLVVISLVSESAREKAEKRVAEMHGGNMTPDQQADWEKKRSALRLKLIQAGKITK